MNSFAIVFNAVVPIFLMIILGYGAKRIKIIGPEFVSQATKFVFRVSLPTMVFIKVGSIELAQGLDQTQIYLMVFCAIAILTAYLIAKVVGRLLMKEKFNKRGNVLGAFMQGAFRSNYMIVGYPVLLNLYGDEIVVNMALVTLAVIPMFNILSIIALTPLNEHKSIKKYTQLLINVIKNPLIIAILLGFISASLRIKYPFFLHEFLDMTAKLATPLGLVAIGAFFHFDDFKDTLSKAITASVLKLLVLPVIMSLAAYLLGFSEMNVILISVLFGGPAAVSSFAMSKEMGGDAVLSGNIIIVSSGFCVLSYILIITSWLSFFS